MHWDWIQIQAVMRIRMNYYTDLDPDPESGNFSYRSKSGSTNLDPHVINFWKKVFLKLRKKKFSFKKDLSKKQQENIGARIFFHFFGQLGLWIVNFCLQPYTFASYLSHFDLCGSGSVVGIRIRIHKVPEYGSNVDPDL